MFNQYISREALSIIAVFIFLILLVEQILRYMENPLFKIDKSIDAKASAALYVYFIAYLCYLFFFRILYSS